MNLYVKIAFRYLFGKKSTNAIHIITWISIIGMAIGTAALILILSVFNGFEGILSGMLSHFNPDIKITLNEGKYMSRDKIDTTLFTRTQGIDAYAFTIEETSFFDYKGSQEVGIIKGVDNQFLKVTGIDTALLYGQAQFGKPTEFALLGSGMNTKLSVNPSDGFTPVNAYMPLRKAKGPLSKEFNSYSFYASGIFSVGNDVDMQYVLVNFDAVNQLLGLENNFSAIEIKKQPGYNDKKLANTLQQALGPAFKVSNRYQQDENFLKIMNIEKWVSYLIACLTLLIIAFNLVGSLWMIVLEKKKDIAILKSMGMTTHNIRWIFLTLGLLVSAIGMVLGYVIGIIMYLLQKNYGIISIPEGFMIDAYPIEIHMGDFIIVTLTVLSIGYISALLPSIRAGKISSFVRQV
ncbi:MAG TPA: FtsX-like permease family protein [Saprospiraceae bacterium]|nr:FtsX-like permease family protein [Saprospiraceae bacterium]HRP42252.1 FtsX-like permease family protein [Saprospiraceae bacterium]